MASTTDYVPAAGVKGAPFEVGSAPITTGVTCYANTFVVANASGVVVTHSAVADGSIPSFRFLGVCLEQVTYSATDENKQRVRFAKTGRWPFALGAGTPQRGLAVYIEDNSTVSLAAASTDTIQAGTITEIYSTTLVEVRIDLHTK